MIFVGWTTTASREDAEKLATGAVEERLAACGQVDGPIVSVYRWQGKLARDEEFRVTFKFLESQAEALERWLQANHPYETPQWLALPAERVSEKYLIWAQNEAI